MSDLPTPHEDLAHVFRAMDRGTKSSKLKVSAVVCANDHTVVDVYRGISGTLWGIYPTERPQSGRSKMTKDHYAADLSNLDHGMPGQTILTSRTLWCRCPDVVLMVFVETLRAAVEAGQRRIVLERQSHVGGFPTDLTEELDSSGSTREFLLGTLTYRV